MDISSLKSQIKSGTLDDFYIFTGPEVGVMHIYLGQIAKTKNASVKILDSITDLGPKAHSRSFVNSACVYVLFEDKEFIANYDLASKLTQAGALRNAILILVYASIDKRSKVYKAFQDHIVDFQPMSEDVLIKYIQKSVNLSASNCRKLAQVCGSDYSRILLEIDKIHQFVDYDKESKNYNEDAAFEYLLKNGTIYSPPRDAVFDFVDAVLRNKKRLAFELLDESYSCGEATLVLLANLYNGAKQLLQVQSYTGEAKITDATGLTPFQVKLASGRKGYNNNGDLVCLMRLTRDAEKGIKTGEIEDQYAVPNILVKYWSNIS